MRLSTLLHLPFFSMWDAHEPADERRRGGGDPNNPHRRRKDDDIQKWWQSRWTKAAVAILLPVLGALANQTYHRYVNLPSMDWVQHVDSHMSLGENKIHEYEQRLSLIEQRQDAAEREFSTWRAEALIERQELRKDIADLRMDLQRWFQRAGTAK